MIEQHTESHFVYVHADGHTRSSELQRRRNRATLAMKRKEKKKKTTRFTIGNLLSDSKKIQNNAIESNQKQLKVTRWFAAWHSARLASCAGADHPDIVSTTDLVWSDK